MITFNRGHFQKFKANIQVFVSAIDRNIEQGEEVEFDGFTAKFAGGEEKPLQKFVRLIERGWLIPANEAFRPCPPQPAGIMVSPADRVAMPGVGKMAMTLESDEAQVVSTVGNFNQIQQAARQTHPGYMSRTAGAQIGGAPQYNSGAQVGPQMAPISNTGVQFGQQAPSLQQQYGNSASMGTGGLQEGTVVGQIAYTGGAHVGEEGAAIEGTSFRVSPSTTMTPNMIVGRQHAASSQLLGQPSQGVSVIHSLTADERAISHSKKGVEEVSHHQYLAPPQQQYVQAAEAPKQQLVRKFVPQEQAQVVPQVPQEQVQVIPQAPQVQVQVVPQAPQEQVQVIPQVQSSDLTAQIVLPASATPNGDFSWPMEGLHWKQRVEEAIKYKDNPVIFMKIMAAETSCVQEELCNFLKGS